MSYDTMDYINLVIWYFLGGVLGNNGVYVKCKKTSIFIMEDVSLI
jgi:hypothetical protein